MNISDKCKRDGSSLSPLLLLCAAALAAAAPSAANATTWYWVGKNKNAAGNHLWHGLNNWTNNVSADETTYGDPQRGDDVVLNDKSYEPYMVCNSSNDDTSSTSPRVALNSITFNVNMNCNQGNFALIGGGDGLKVTVADYKASNWTGILLEGSGDVPIDIVHAGAVFNSQMRMVSRKDPSGDNNPALVKKGLGELRCFVQGGSRNYTIPLTKVQQGTIDITTGKPFKNCEFRFDSNDESALISFGFSRSYMLPFVLGDGCALTESAEVANTAHGFTTPFDLQVQFTGTPAVDPTKFSGQFYGGAGLLWDPPSPDYTFIYSNAVSSTTGRVHVTKGTLKLVNGASFTSLESLTVGTPNTGVPAVLDIGPGSGANLRAGKLDVYSGSAFMLANGVAVTVREAKFDGVPLLSGTYTGNGATGTPVTWIDGPGTVTVLAGLTAATTTWIGAAASDTIAAGDNWNPSSPDMSSGNTFAVFASGGSSATLDRAANFAGLALRGGFNFLGSSTLTVGEWGVLALDTQTPAEFTFDCPIEASAGQPWAIGTNNTVTVGGGISGAGAIAVTGNGKLNLHGAGERTGPIDIGTRTKISGNNALGSAGTVSRVRNDSNDLCFSSATNDAAVSFYSLGAPNDFSVLRFEGDNVFNGAVTNQMNMFHLVDGATVEFAKQYRGNIIRFKGAGNVVFREKMTLSDSTRTWYITDTDTNVTLDFYKQYNTFSGTFWCEFHSGTVRFHEQYAMCGDGANDNNSGSGCRIKMSGTATMDLMGNDQSLDGLASTGGGTVTSEEPAFLHWLANRPYNGTNDPEGGLNRTNMVVFAGMAGLSYEGAATNRLGAASTTAGTLKVTKGKLIVLPQASWGNCTNIIVTGGILAIENPQAFSEKVVVNVSGTGKIELGFNGAMKCDNLFIDGERMQSAVFGSDESPAPYKDAHFLGQGTIQTRPRGFSLTLR